MEIKKITRHSIAAEAATKFARTFGLGIVRRPQPYLVELHKNLLALGESPDPDAVEPLVGHQITVPECDNCGQEGKDFVFELGEEPALGEFERYFLICPECVEMLMINLTLCRRA